MYFTDRGIEELNDRRGDETGTLGWFAEKLRELVDLNRDVLGGRPDFILPGTVLHVPKIIDDRSSVEDETYVVQPGDTLWTIATEVAPDRDPRAVVDALRSANDGSATLQVGARLEVDID